MTEEECPMCGGRGHNARECPWRRDRRFGKADVAATLFAGLCGLLLGFAGGTWLMHRPW